VSLFAFARNILAQQDICNNDLGMQDIGITDAQISASSWLIQFPPEAARPFQSGWCSDINDENPYIMVTSFCF
jgi:hypothetical protein